MVSPLRTIRHLRRYRQVLGVFLKHGFGFALDYLGIRRPLLSLPRRRRTEMPIREGMALHLRLALEELGPTFVKLGQILSTRPDLLPPAYIAELSKLQDAVPPTAWDAVRALLEQELGREVVQVFAELDPMPIAAASLAQVYAAQLPDGENVIVKVQRPEITSLIETDLEILAALASAAQRTPAGRVYDPVGIVDDFAFTLRNELDYRREGRNADRFRANFAGEEALYIPRVFWEYTTRRVLVLERIHGIKIDDIAALDTAGYDRHRVALRSARIIIKEVLEDGFFHADPHPGNFVVMPGEVIGAMDFGMVGHLGRQDRLNLVRLYIASIRLEAEQIAEQLIRMGATAGKVDRSSLARDIGRLLTKYRGLPLKEIRAGEVVEEIMPIAFRHNLRLPRDLWLLGKTLAMLEGVGLRLDPNFDMFAVSEPFVRKLMRGMMKPGAWGPELLGDLEAWGYLLSQTPRVGTSLIRGFEQGEFPLLLKVDASGQTMSRLSHLFTQLSLSVLIAALIIGLAMLLPLVASSALAQTLVGLGIGLTISFGLWLVLSILRGGK